MNNVTVRPSAMIPNENLKPMLDACLNDIHNSTACSHVTTLDGYLSAEWGIVSFVGENGRLELSDAFETKYGDDLDSLIDIMARFAEPGGFVLLIDDDESDALFQRTVILFEDGTTKTIIPSIRYDNLPVAVDEAFDCEPSPLVVAYDTRRQIVVDADITIRQTHRSTVVTIEIDGEPAEEDVVAVLNPTYDVKGVRGLLHTDLRGLFTNDRWPI